MGEFVEELGAIIGLCFICFLMGYFSVGLKWFTTLLVAVVVAYYIRRIVLFGLLAALIPGLRSLIVLSIIIFTLLMLVVSLTTYFLGVWVRKVG